MVIFPALQLGGALTASGSMQAMPACWASLRGWRTCGCPCREPLLRRAAGRSLPLPRGSRPHPGSGVCSPRRALRRPADALRRSRSPAAAQGATPRSGRRCRRGRRRRGTDPRRRRARSWPPSCRAPRSGASPRAPPETSGCGALPCRHADFAARPAPPAINTPRNMSGLSPGRVSCVF